MTSMAERQPKTGSVKAMMLEEMTRTFMNLSLALMVAAMLSGCGRDNGLPRDLAGHLAPNGISISAAQTHAPLSGRDGYLMARHDPGIATRIVSTFNLEKITDDDPRWRFALQHAGAIPTAKEVWGASGRPAKFKLKDGGQFEYFYLVITADGWMYLVAEYAYG